MKKIFSFFIIVTLCLMSVLPVFSQKTRSISLKKVSAPKTLPPSNVKLSSAEGFSDGNGVYLQWQAESEIQNLGFYIYRIGAKGAELVSPEIVGGASLRSRESIIYGEKYSFFDAGGDLTSSYYIESIGVNGQRQTFDQFFPKYLDNLASVAGSTSAELIKRREKTKLPNETNLVNLPKDLKAQVDANSLPPDINTHRWVAAQPGAKISVKQEGVYRVSRAELQNAGFNVNAPGNLWQLYLDGKEQSIIVGANDSYIEFYGKGIDTPESAIKVYYLIVGAQDGKRIGTTVLRTLSGNVTSGSYFQTFIKKERQQYVSNGILNGEAENYFSNLPILGANTPTPPTTTLTFNLTGVDFSVPKCSIELGVQGLTSTSHQILAKINGEPMDLMTGNGKFLMTGYFQVSTGVLREGENTLQLQSFAGSGDFNLTESIKIDYWRKYEANQNRVSFYTANYRTSTVSGFTSPNIRVFDLTFPDNPTQLTNLRIDNNSGNYSFVLPSNRGRAMFAVEDSAILAADSVVQNNPSTLATTGHNGEMIIVSYKAWMTQANDWANYRRGQGMTVEVVDIDDIFDEFGYGTATTASMTDFFKYAKNNWQTPPNYVLLLGDMSCDFRNYENRPFQNFILTKLVDTFYEETGSDEALCDFNNDGLSEIAIGRVPARTPQDVTQSLTKTMAFESMVATGFSRGAVFPSDRPDGYDFDALNHRVADQLPANMSKTFINRGDTDSHTVLINAVNAGPFILNYSGHGSTGAWQSNFLTMQDALAMTNAPNYSIYTLLTCFNGYFLRTDNESLGEALMKSQNGGAVTVWASTGETTPPEQEVMATRFYSQLAVSNMTRMGDFVMDAKQHLTGGRDVRLSWVLLGDPTLKIK